MNRVRPDFKTAGVANSMRGGAQTARRIMPPGILFELENWARYWPRVRRVFRESLISFYTEDSLTLSASIAYYSLLSVFPFLLLLLGLSGIYIRHYELSGRLAIVLERYLPMKPDAILRNLADISRAYGRVSLICFLLLLWSSSGVFLPLEKALNRAWKVQKERSWWRSRLLALEMSMILGFIILASSSVVGVNVYIHKWVRGGVFQPVSPLIGFIYHILVICTTFGMTLAMFVILFKRLPNCPMRPRQVLPSAFLTAILWEAARSLFTRLLPLFNYRRVYGSIGVVVALMTWAYISSAVMLFGAEVSRALYCTAQEPKPPDGVLAPPTVQSARDVR